MKLPIIVVEWHDSRGVTGGWENRETCELLDHCVCVSAGVLVDETEDYVTLAVGADEAQFIGRLSIPTRAIVKEKRFDFKTT